MEPKIVVPGTKRVLLGTKKGFFKGFSYGDSRITLLGSIRGNYTGKYYRIKANIEFSVS
jgi:hypothetical protein